MTARTDRGRTGSDAFDLNRDQTIADGAVAELSECVVSPTSDRTAHDGTGVGDACSNRLHFGFPGSGCPGIAAARIAAARVAAARIASATRLSRAPARFGIAVAGISAATTCGGTAVPCGAFCARFGTAVAGCRV